MRVAEHGIMVITTETLLPKFLQLMRAEYTEVPGLHLTKAQVQRLWCLDPATSDAVLGELIAERFLRKKTTGAYVRAEENR